MSTVADFTQYKIHPGRSRLHGTHMESKGGWQSRSQGEACPVRPSNPSWGSPCLVLHKHPGLPNPSVQEKLNHDMLRCWAGLMPSQIRKAKTLSLKHCTPTHTHLHCTSKIYPPPPQPHTHTYTKTKKLHTQQTRQNNNKTITQRKKEKTWRRS